MLAWRGSSFVSTQKSKQPSAQAQRYQKDKPQELGSYFSCRSERLISKLEVVHWLQQIFEGFHGRSPYNTHP